MIGDLYFGACGYADDLGLIAPCREALQQMIKICKDFFDKHGIEVSTNPDIDKTKTKIITFGVKTKCAAILLGNIPLPYVNKWPHLGHVICSDECSVHDLEEKKRVIIGKIHSLRQELSDQDPVVYIKLIRIYFLHLYGCTLWDIFSNEAVQLWTMWHRTIKSLFKLPLPTHRYLLTDIVPGVHLKKTIMRRFLKFQSTIATSTNPHIRVLYNHQKGDWRSTFGRNCMNLCREAGVVSMEQVIVDDISVNPVPAGEEWRAGLLQDLISARSSTDNLLTPAELEDMINTVCCQ